MKRIKAKKGFTMIEIIIVLVILAILIGAAAPSFIGFVNEARAKTQMQNARLGYQAAQNVWAEYNAIGTNLSSTGSLYANGVFRGAALTKFHNYLGGELKSGEFAFRMGTTGITQTYFNPGGDAAGTLVVVNTGGTTDIYLKGVWTNANVPSGVTFSNADRT